MALISCAVTVQLICVFVFAYAKIWFSHDSAHIKQSLSLSLFNCKFQVSLQKHISRILLFQLHVLLNVDEGRETKTTSGKIEFYVHMNL